MAEPDALTQPDRARAIGAIDCLIGSALVFRQRIALSLALGAATVLGLVASFCLVGALIAPWFLCEMLALQLGYALAFAEIHDSERPSLATPSPLERHGGWLGAGVVLLGAVVLTASVGWLVGLGLSTESIAGDMAASMALPDLAWVLVPASASAALVFVQPFLYAPLLLIERPMPVLSAMLESARIVRSAGVVNQLWLTLHAHVVQVAPLLIGSFAAHVLVGPESGSLWALWGLPFMAVTIPLGQGMIVWSYAQRAKHEARASTVRLRPAQMPRLAVIAVALWCALVLSPLASFGLLGASLVRPSRVQPGELPAGIELLGTIEPALHQSSLVVPATALTVRVDGRKVHVEASDGGGAGELPLRTHRGVTRVRVGRSRDNYAIAIEQSARHSLTYVDRAGVRQDDDLRARLADRMPTTALAMLVLALLATALVQLPVLAALSEVVFTDETLRMQTPAVRRALAFGVLLAPLAGASLWYALRAVI